MKPSGKHRRKRLGSPLGSEGSRMQPAHTLGASSGFAGKTAGYTWTEGTRQMKECQTMTETTGAWCCPGCGYPPDECGCGKAQTTATTNWQTISTAPKNYQPHPMLLWDGVDYHIGWWVVSAGSFKFEGWTTGWETAGGYDVGYNQINPTHWQPLPDPPEAAENV